nr:uncharacterized protein LOC108004631 [Drosophila suzukii]
MLKYLAGIFAKPRNDYVDGRLTTPLTKKMASIRDPQPRISLKTIINRDRITTCKGKGNRNPQVSRPQSRSPRKFAKSHVDPISYIVDVSNSSSSLDEGETIPQLPSNTKLLEDQNKNKKSREFIPVPPPVSRVQSWTGPFNANPFNEHDNLSTSRQFSINGEQDPMGWELDWLPEEFWSASSEPEVINKEI